MDGVLAFALVLTVGMALIAALYYLLRHSPGRTVEIVLLAVSAMAFVFIGVGAINTMTNGRGAPDETAPWFVLIAIVAIGAYYRFGRRARPAQEAASRKAKTPRVDPVSGATRRGSAVRSGSAVFISYRRADSADVTGRIYDRLLAHFGKESIFKDVDSIPFGVDFRQHVSIAVGDCRVLLAIIGRDWLGTGTGGAQRRIDDATDFVRIEIESALERSIVVIPVLVQGASMPTESDLPRSLHALTYRNAIAVRPDPDFHQDVARLIKSIEAHCR
jgi:hypothetical protein